MEFIKPFSKLSKKDVVGPIGKPVVGSLATAWLGDFYISPTSKTHHRNMNFKYPEDREFFAQLLCNGDTEKLDENFKEYFDFRHPAIKRWEFNKTRKKVLKELIEKYGEECQLKIHPECSIVKKFEPDHIIPLSSNELNKKLRHMERTSTEKVPAQSFGSNHPKNLILSCSRCNAYKKHRFLDKEIIQKILSK